MSSSGLSLGYRGFRLPRQGYGPEECQDALAGDAARGRFAIADGAAESPYSALWAQLLVDEFVRQNERATHWADWLPSLQERWSVQVIRSTRTDYPPLLHEGGGRKKSPFPLMGEGGGGGIDFDNGVPWYLEPGLNQGAFATFLGLILDEHGWRALAVGDSCLFQIRQGELIHAFPLAAAAEFSNAPWLVGSRTSPDEVPHKNGLQHQGDWLPRDCFWLMTDALAQWFLTQVECGEKPWLALEPLLHSADDAIQAFAAWIEGLRATHQLRNDDVTLLGVRV